jgi:hypothetical protein
MVCWDEFIKHLAFYIYIDNSVTRNTYENDMKMLKQIQKNYENTNKLIINFYGNTAIITTELIEENLSNSTLNSPFLEGAKTGCRNQGAKI